MNGGPQEATEYGQIQQLRVQRDILDEQKLLRKDFQGFQTRVYDKLMERPTRRELYWILGGNIAVGALVVSVIAII